MLHFSETFISLYHERERKVQNNNLLQGVFPNIFCKAKQKGKSKDSLDV